MKKIMIILGALNAGLVLLVVGLLFLAETYPFRPGIIFFGIQSFAEQQQVRLTADPSRRAEMSFDLVERRLLDLTIATPERLDHSVQALDDCLSAAIRNIETVPAEQKKDLYKTVDDLLLRVNFALAGVNDKISSEALLALQDKVAKLQTASSSAEIQKLVQENPRLPALVLSQSIPFLGEDVDHSIFPLEGGHADLECELCHDNGEYADSPNTCSACHLIEDELALNADYAIVSYFSTVYKSPRHYVGECSDCHVDVDWETIVYDHFRVKECASCHTGDIPHEKEAVESARYVRNVIWRYNPQQVKNAETHYPGEDCSECHTDTESWEEAGFDHHLETCQNCHSYDNFQDFLNVDETCTRMQSCQECHTYDQHEESYSGDCLNCHIDVKQWLNIDVDHTLYPVCVDCHLDDKPAQHYPGNCSTCHATSNWSRIYFTHNPTSDCATCHEASHANFGLRCSSCHTTDSWYNSALFHNFGTCANCHNAPVGHYPLVCSACHNTGSWGGATYNHSGITTCTQCHEVPDLHYPGACLVCHNTDSWYSISYNHTGVTSCTECHATPAGHYLGSCLNCHETSSWSDIHFSHIGLTNCTSCHTTPAAHWPGSCTLCHSTSNWYDANYTHKASDNCSSCHAAPTGHWPGQCSKCHVSTAWIQVNFDHTGYTDCKSCHDRPINHGRGQCSKCHSTDTWYLPSPTPTNTPVPTDPPAPTATPEPTVEPTVEPTIEPTVEPTVEPTIEPTVEPTPEPTEEPTPTPDPIVTVEPF